MIQSFQVIFLIITNYNINYLTLLEKFFPINNTFTKEFVGGNFKNNSLNTATTFSKVHDTLDQNY